MSGVSLARLVVYGFLSFLLLVALWLLLGPGTTMVATSGGLFLFYLLFWLLLLAVNLLFAVGVARDAAARKDTATGAFFVAPVVWGLATVVGGLFAVSIYWVFHHSTLRRD